AVGDLVTAEELLPAIRVRAGCIAVPHIDLRTGQRSARATVQPRDGEGQLQGGPGLRFAAPRLAADVRAIELLVDAERPFGLLRTDDAGGYAPGALGRGPAGQQRGARQSHERNGLAASHAGNHALRYRIMSDEALRTMALQVRNWGKWGPDDELGTLN